MSFGLSPVAELRSKKILLGVGGSVAAVKAPSVATLLAERGAEVKVVMTQSAQHFITPLAMQSVSGHAVVTGLWDGEEIGNAMPHLELGGWADAFVIVGASANLLARLAHGFADDAVTATALVTGAPLLLAPGMETAMWEHQATQANVETLMERGVLFVGPVQGRLASGKEGAGRMAEPDEIVTAVEAALASL
jgi:phosphopantothenoylcysteine decarboxylase / phosphopantothenate---cysteine ligase